jgi:murein L,D-transpeptidase YafK/outer membrane murein-binding lipoprotein Lpp
MRFSLLTTFFLLISVAGCAHTEEIQLASANIGRYNASLDSLVATTIQDIRASKPDAAMASVDRLIAMRPDFKLAHLLKADLLQAKAMPLASFGAAPKSRDRAALNDLKDEARVRLLRYLDQPDPDRLPKQILQLAPNQKYALLADASRARLYVFENVGGEPRLIRDFYVTVGRNGVNKRAEGDKKTPSGVYSINAELPRKQLTAFYGAGAFPLDYPNEWDALQGNGGHGIWLHGVPPDTYSRPPKASEGCLVVANPDYHEISRYIRPQDTPIVIADRTEWLDRQDWLATRDRLIETLEGWKTDWQRLDADRYLSRYSSTYLERAGAAWVASKRRNISQKSWIRVSLSDLSLFLYPGDDLAVVNFTQTYDSDKHHDVTRKRFYLKRDDEQWRIVLEKGLQGTPASLASND